LDKVVIPTIEVDEEQYDVACEIWDLGPETEAEDDDDRW